jgi:hypothetical protein
VRKELPIHDPLGLDASVMTPDKLLRWGDICPKPCTHLVYAEKTDFNPNLERTRFMYWGVDFNAKCKKSAPPGKMREGHVSDFGVSAIGGTHRNGKDVDPSFGLGVCCQQDEKKGCPWHPGM